MIDHRDNERDLPAVQLVWDRRYTSIKELESRLKSDPGFNEQTRWELLASDYESLAAHGIALGRADPRDHLKLCCEATLEVFKRRGTTKNEFSYVLTRGGITGPPPDQQIDYSLTNSKQCLKATFRALSLGEFELAKEIALLAWDPPKARYISQRSETCRPYDANIAQCIKQSFSGEQQVALAKLKKLFISPKEKRGVLLRDGLIALLENDHDETLDGINRIVEWHKRLSVRDHYNCFLKTELYLCYWALGLASWGIHDGIIKANELTSDYQAFPVDWLSNDECV